MATAESTKVRSLLKVSDVDADEFERLLDLGEAYKAQPDAHLDALRAQTVAMFFEKPSTRTRTSFAAAAHRLGALPLGLRPDELQLGRGEPIADTARVLSRYVDGIMIRTFAHADVEELARAGSVPVINGLTDLLHPCQVLADVLTIRQHLGGTDGRVVAWIGDGNNMANSWINAAWRLGFELRLACPEGYDPDPDIVARAGSHVRVVRDPADAVHGAHVVNTDVWASMGQEEEQAQRARAFRGYTVDAALMRRAARDAIFLHCLPAHRGEEVAAEVIDGPQSRVWDEAENRLHAQKAVMAVLMGAEPLA
jgi:ornithine carbamoyltransferase